MKKKSLVFLMLSGLSLSACHSYLPQPTGESQASIDQRRAEIRALEEEDYQAERRKRRDSIQDLGEMEMNRAKAINKSYENRSKQNIYIIR